MTGRRRSRAKKWTHKKSKSAHLQLGEPTAPKAAAWESLEQHGSFVVTDEHDQEHVFTVEDVAAIVPAGKHSERNLPLDQHWMARIKDIRSKENGEVWVKVNWFYSPQETSEQVATFDPTQCANNERIYSHHSEVVSALTFEGLVTMVQFFEDDPDQVRILPGQFFYRYYLETNRAIFNISRYTCDALESLGSNTCGCGRPYNPDEMASHLVMHWCPRPSCRRGYHRECLIENAYQVLRKGRYNLVCARLSSSPDTDEPVVIPTEDNIRRVPEQLVALAAQPMVRGGRHGVAGNVAIVVRARRVVYRALFILARDQSVSGSNSDSDSESSKIFVVDAQLDLDLDLDFWYEDPGFASWEDAIFEAGPATNGNRSNEVNGLFVCPACAGAL
ncbi:hypothetical protein C8R46DRAFT_1075008 [Mycena filopes]|nr:hypothetical protein C8R46DRAFT_1075008 [Mycena filopes]